MMTIRLPKVLSDTHFDLPLAGQVALVTGASRGIGKAIATRFAMEGAHVALHYNAGEEAVQILAESIRAFGRKVQPIRADLSGRDGPIRLAEAFDGHFDRLDILVNNAGITRDNLLLSMSDEELESVIQTNLLGPIRVTRALVMRMLRRRYGRIVNVSSSSATKPGRGQSNYAAAKGGLEAFTKAMAVELSPRGILVNAVAPGVIETDMSASIRETAIDEIYSRLLVKRCATPEEVADAVMYLASPRNCYVTGEVIRLDGGLKMA